VQVAAILLVHVGVRYFAHRLGLEHEWWVEWLKRTSAALSVFVFLFTTGVEAVVECWLTTYSGWTRIKDTMHAAPEEPQPRKRTGV